MGRCWCFLLSSALIVALLGSTARTSEPAFDEEGLPAAYGQVLYSQNESSPKQLYIVAISHQDTLTGASSPYAPRVDAEIYGIGAWLARNKGMELLLPEGFFLRKKETGPWNASASGVKKFRNGDLKELERMFATVKKAVNPEEQLSRDLSLPIQQVEERDLYQVVNKGIRELSACTDLQQHFLIRSELDYHQDKRVGAMLQKIPHIVEDAKLHGIIQQQNALFTIGLSHIPTILRFLKQEKVAVSCPLFTTSQTRFEDCSEELNLAREGFGVTVILPRSLADDPHVLKRNGLKAS